MKNFLLLIFLNVFTISAQEKEFILSEKGITDFVVTNVEGKDKNLIYKKTIEWIKLNYKNPEKVIKTEIENEYVRINGTSDKMFCFVALDKMYYPAEYTIEISFKDNKYKFDILDLKYFNVVWKNFDLNDASMYYKKKGGLKNYCKYLPEIATYFNNLNNDLKDYIINEKIKNSDW